MHRERGLCRLLSRDCRPSEWHARVLGLSAGVATHHVGVSEEAGPKVTISGLHQVGIGIGAVAGGPEFLLAEKTVAARNGERDDNPVAALEIFHFLSYFFNNAHELVSHDVADMRVARGAITYSDDTIVLWPNSDLMDDSMAGPGFHWRCQLSRLSLLFVCIAASRSGSHTRPEAFIAIQMII